MPSDTYWAERFKQLETAQNGIGQSAVAEMERQYRMAQREIEGQISAWYDRFAANNQIDLAEARQYLKGADLEEFKWTLQDYISYGQQNAVDGKWIKQLENASAKYHISKLESLDMQVQNSIENLYSEQNATVTKAMSKAYESGYYHTAFEVQKGIGVGWDIASLDTNQVSKVLSKPWAVDGVNFSDRIWDNKNKLIETLENTLTQNIMLGRDPQEAIDAIAKQLKTSKSNAGRLVMTEEAYFSSAAQKDCFNMLGVQQYKIVATLDSVTDDFCAGLDGQVFDMTDFQAGVTAPPYHPWCRCTTCPYFPDQEGLGERFARNADGTTYTVPGNCTYNQWKEAFVNGNDSVLQEILEGAVFKSDLFNGPGKIEFIEAKTIKEAEDFAHNVCGIETVSYKGCDIKVANAMNESLVDAINYCPELKDEVHFYGVAQERNKLAKAEATEFYLNYYRERFSKFGYEGAELEKLAGSYAKRSAGTFAGKVESDVYAIAYSGKFKTAVEEELQAIATKYSGIGVNKAMAKNYDSMLASIKSDVAIEFHPVGTDSARAIFDHEFGHQLDYLYDLRDNKEIKELFSKSSSNEIKKNLSQYGASNIQEFIAEGYSEYLNNPEPRDVASTIGKVIEGKVKG